MKNIRYLIEIIQMVYRILTKRQRIGAIGVFLSMLICSCLELVGVSMIYPFLELIVAPEGIEEKWYLKWIYNIWPTISTMTVMIIIGIGMMIVFLCKNAVAVICAKIKFRYASRFNRDASIRMFRSYLSRPYEFFVNTNSSVILRGITSDTDAVYNTLLSLFRMLSESITIIMISIFLVYSDWVLALAALTLSCVCFFVSVLLFKNKSKEAGLAYRQASIEQSKCCGQPVIGIKEVKVMDRADQFVDKFIKAAEELAHAYEVRGVISSCPDRFIEGTCLSGFMAIICIRIAMGGDMSSFIPTIGVFAMGSFKLLPSISTITILVNDIVYFQFGVKSCYENLLESKRIEKELSKTTSHISDKFNNYNNKDNWSEIQVKDVSWKYQNSNENVLSHLSISIKRGESVGLIGPSGAGKTTLADVILGLLKPQTGEVKLDGEDVYNMPHQWSKLIGYVPQTAFLTDDTIRENITFGIPENEINDDLVEKALKKAQLYDFVMGLPDKTNSPVGERGTKLSGGQRQRIAIARALYCDPDILVFDEATSSLDNDTEAAVMESIDALTGIKTMIIIAHRLSTIKNCDKIYEIKDGVATLRDKREVLSSF